MNIELCVDGSYAVTAKKAEKPDLKKIRSDLKQQGFSCADAETKHKLLNGHLLCEWSWPKEKSKIKLDFHQTENPYIITLLIYALNNWGWDCIVKNDSGEDLVFERPEAFYLEDIPRMIGE